MIRRFPILLAFFSAAVALPLNAQTGCVDSPESPTLILALVGGIGLVAVILRTARGTKE
jgi:XrtJ-associated TM-motif-TM protein